MAQLDLPDVSIKILRILVFGSCALGQSMQHSPQAIVMSEFINEHKTYSESHASTIAETTAGDLVAAWFGGTGEGNADVGIWFARRANDRWTDAAKVATGIQGDGGTYPTWNPVLFQTPRGPLFLFYKVGLSPEKWWGMVVQSKDGGRTWHEPRRLPAGQLGPTKNKPVVLRDGTWLAGSSTEESSTKWRVHFELSHDQGRSWEVVGPVDRGKSFDAIQPTILAVGGKLEALCRTQQGVIAMTSSTDGGRSWTPIEATELPNPNSGIDGITLKDGRQLLVYNHSVPLPGRSGWGNRYPLDVAISPDGHKWKHVLTLESAPRLSGYAYPAVIQTSDGLVHITYTWDRKMIKHVTLDARRLD